MGEWALIGAAIIWCWRGQVLADRSQSILLATVVLAGLAGTVMNLNFHLASGGHHRWFLAKDAFGEGVDLDSLLPVQQLTIVAASGKLLWDTRRDRRRKMVVARAGASAVGARATRATAAAARMSTPPERVPTSLPSGISDLTTLSGRDCGQPGGLSCPE